MDISLDKRADSALTGPGTLAVAAGASVVAGLIHYGVVPDHRAEWMPQAVLFTLVGAFQILWAAALWADGRRSLYWPGLLVNASLLVIWLVSRTTGLPFGPHAGEAEPVGILDLISCAAELATVAMLISAMRGRAGQGDS